MNPHIYRVTAFYPVGLGTGFDFNNFTVVVKGGVVEVEFELAAISALDHEFTSLFQLLFDVEIHVLGSKRVFNNPLPTAIFLMPKIIKRSLGSERLI